MRKIKSGEEVKEKEEAERKIRQWQWAKHQRQKQKQTQMAIWQNWGACGMGVGELGEGEARTKPGISW